MKYPCRLAATGPAGDSCVPAPPAKPTQRRSTFVLLASLSSACRCAATVLVPLSGLFHRLPPRQLVTLWGQAHFAKYAATSALDITRQWIRANDGRTLATPATLRHRRERRRLGGGLPAFRHPPTVRAFSGRGGIPHRRYAA